MTAGAIPIFIDGGDAIGAGDAITIAADVNSATFNTGPETDEGSFAIGGAAGLVSFDHVESLTVVGTSVAGNAATVNGNSADNDITLTATGTDDFTVGIDGQTVTFTDFNSATLNGGDGDDDVTVTYLDGTAFTTTVAVNGQSPTGHVGDTLHVEGTTSGETIALTASTITVVGSGAITYGTVEGLSIDALGGADTITVTGSTAYDYTPSGSADAGTLLADSLPISFSNLGSGETLNLDGTSLVAHGTDSDNTFALSSTGLVLDSRVNITRTGLTTLTLDGLAGDDTFTIGSDHGYATVNVDGGSPSNTDVATITADGLNPVTVTLGTSPVSTTDATVANTGIGTVNLSGVEVANVVAGTQNVTVNGSGEDDDLTYQPTGAEAGTVTKAGLGVVTNLSGVGDLTIDGIGGDDTLTVVGTTAVDAFTVTATSVVHASLQDANTISNVDALSVSGGESADTFGVTAGAIPIFIDGGDPIGSTNTGDTINVMAGNQNTIFFPGPEGDEGGIDVGGDQSVSYDHIENLTITDPDEMRICGTNDDDEITVLANGPDDFLFSVNDSPLATVIDANSVLVEGKAGDDDIVMQASLTFAIPVTLDGDFVAPFVGGAPSSDGDTIKINTPYAGEAAEYRPGTSSGGTLTLTTAGSVITLDDAEEFLFDGESNGTGAFATALTVFGNAGTNALVHTPGNGTDEGNVRVDNLLAVTYEGLTGLTLDGEGAADDRVVYNGTGFSDTFGVAAGSSTIDLRHFVGFVGGAPVDHIAVVTTDVEEYSLRGADGDDVFDVWPQVGIDIRVEGDGPGASDILNFNVDVADPAPNGVIVELDDPATPANLVVQTITQQGLGVVTLSGIETANIDANSNDLVIAGTRIDDVIHYTPSSTDSGTVTADGIATVFNFDDVPQGANSFTITGGAGGFADKVELSGTSGRDLIRVDSPNRTASVEVLGFGAGSGTLWRNVTLDDGTTAIGTPGIIESITADGDDGDDTFWVASAAAVGNGLYVNVQGGDPRASDALLITNLNADGTLAFLSDADDYIIIHRSRTADAGNVLPFNATVRRPSVSYENTEVVLTNFDLTTPQNNRNNGDPNITVMGPDFNEPNEFRTNAAYVGSGETLQIQHAEIFPNATEHPGIVEDHDYYRVVALDNGTLDFQVYFHDQNALVPGDGNLDIEVLDAAGNVLTGFGSNEGAGDEDERVRIPAVSGQTYYLHVFGEVPTLPDVPVVINGYDVTVVNEPPAVPYDIELDDLPVDNTYDCTTNPPSGLNSDTGRSHFDNITCDAQPTIIFRLDDAVLLQDIQGNDGTTFPNNPPDENIPIPFISDVTTTPATAGFRVPVFVEGDPQQGTVEPQVPVGYAQPGAEPGVYVFDFSLAAHGSSTTLTDGSHFINARVQIIDPSTPTQTGYGARSESLEIVVDTVVPPVFFGITSSTDDGLHPDSDSGVQGNNTGNNQLEVSFTDRITNDRTPTFYGLAEANSFVQVYLDVNQNSTVDGLDVLLGQTNTVPFDGNNQFGNATGDFPNGQWELTSTVDMNDPDARNNNGAAVALGYDGLRRILVVSEDVAGNINQVTGAGDTAQILDIFIDTQGPQVTDVDINNAGNPFNLFDHKYEGDGTLRPTPLVNSLVISVQDLPNRVTNWLYQAVEDRGANGNPAENPGHYEVKGDAEGVIPLQSVVYNPIAATNGNPATGTITLTFLEPLPDDRFTLTISDEIKDPAGNALDGESQLNEPHDSPVFPSGDGQPGGDFVARFTVDSRPEVGVWGSGNVWVDINGNETFDPINRDFTNRDIVYSFGNGNGGTNQAFTSDDFFAGNFRDTVSNVADGFDKLAVYGNVGAGLNGPWRFLVDTDNDGVPNVVQDQNASGFSGTLLNGLPVAGNFAPTDGDEVGVFNGATWLLDTTGNYVLDTQINSQLRGYPIVGDFDGDGLDDLGTWHNESSNTGQFQFDLANDGLGVGPIQTIDFGFLSVRERPVAADLDQDGIDDVGLWVPDRAGVMPGAGAEWFFLVSGDPTGANRVTSQVNTLQHAFEPVPFGDDLYMQFGDEYGLPILGNFDPPIGPDGEGQGGAGGPENPVFHRLDVNKDGSISPIDALQVINTLNGDGPREAARALPGERDYDANEDRFVTSRDVGVIVNYLNSQAVSEGEGEGLTAISLNSGIDRAAILADLGEGEASLLQFSTFAMPNYSVGTSVFEQADAPASSKLDAAADEVLASVVNGSRATIKINEVRHELFAETDLEDDLLDALANDVSGRQKHSDLDEIFGDLT